MAKGKAVWEQRVRRLEESDLTTAEFAAELGINPKTLTYWKWRLRKERRSSSARATSEQKPTFVEVKPERAQSVAIPAPIEIVIDGRTVVRVSRDFEPEVLRLVVATLASGVT